MTIDELISRHPKIFHGRQPEIAIGPGWVSLVDELCSALESVLVDDAFHAHQIKEKFGELRFYYAHPRCDFLDEIISAASEKSKTVCEECGGAGDLFKAGGTFLTLCEAHARAKSEHRGVQVFFVDDDGKTVPLPSFTSRAPVTEKNGAKS